jgi:signal peptidase II
MIKRNLNMPLFFFAAILSLVADQLSKIWIRDQLPEGAQIDVLPGWIHLEHVRNFGAAWGMLSGQKWLLIAFTAIVVCVIGFSAREVASRGKLAATGFGLILGGAVGNLIDRVMLGHVTDFFDLDTPWPILQTFPVFNVADSALTVGVVLMLLSTFLTRPESQPVISNSQP